MQNHTERSSRSYHGLIVFPFAVEQGLKYAKSHEWAKIDSDTATVGISDFAQVVSRLQNLNFGL